MQLFIHALLVITYVAGTFCQKITFDGRITGGRLYIDGTIGENVTELLLQNWQPIIYIQVKRINDSTFFLMCAFDLSSAPCKSDPVGKCQCLYNTTADNVHFVVNDTASPDLYSAIIRARWQHTNLTTVYSNKNYMVLKPDDVLSTTVEPTTDGNTATAATDETITTTKSSSSTSNMTEPPQSEDDIVRIVCLSVIIPVVVIAIVIGIVWYFKAKSKQSKAVSNNGTDRTAKPDKSEQPKPDRQYPEHTNRVYEERRTSPSNVTIDEVKATPNVNLQQHNSDKEDVNNSHIKDKTNDGCASQTVPGKPRQLPPLKVTNIHGQLQPTGQPRPPSVEITSPTVKHNN